MTTQKFFTWHRVALFLSAITLVGFGVSGCTATSTTGTVDTSGSTSEAAAAAVGSAVNGTMTDSVSYHTSSTKCPVASGGVGTLPADNSGTCAVSADSMTLTFAVPCQYNSLGTGATWLEGTVLTTSGGTAPTCGTFPAVASSGITAVNRSYLCDLDKTAGNCVSYSSNAYPTIRVNATQTATAALDTTAPSSSTFAPASTANILLSTFTSGTGGFSYNINSGGGYTRTYDTAGGGTITHKISIALRAVGLSGDMVTSSSLPTTLFDHTISTQYGGSDHPLTAVISGTTHTVDGTLYVQHNLIQSLATITATGLTYDLSSPCCYPTSGTLAVSFSGGANSGLTETTTFSSAACTLGTLGQVSFIDVNGNPSTKTFTHCF